MRKYIIFSIVLGLIYSCSSSSKFFQKQQYDLAIEKSIKKLIKDPSKTEEINILNDAFRIANEKDNDRINFLLASNEDDIWDEIYSRYNRLKNRQDKVSVLRQSILEQISFEKIDYDQKIIDSKKNAAEYYYNNGVVFLNKGDRFNARKAYDQFNRVERYYSQYKNTTELKQQALVMGTTHVLFKMVNNSGAVLPGKFESELLKISLSDINSKWVNYDTWPVEHQTYDYSIYLNIKTIDVSPELIKETEYSESIEVSDGFQYVLDTKGNVMKDTSGNDIKVEKFKTINAYIKQTTLSKSAIVKGSLDFYDNTTRQLIKTTPISSESIFNYSFGEAWGELDALSEESGKLIKNPPTPFPHDLDMIFETNEELKQISKNIIFNNKSLFQ